MLARSILLGCAVAMMVVGGPGMAQDRLPWERSAPPYPREETYQPSGPVDRSYDTTRPSRSDDAYRPSAGNSDVYSPPGRPTYGERQLDEPPYGTPYAAPSDRYAPGPEPRRDYYEPDRDRTFSQNEILSTGHRFFGSVSQGLAKAVEYAFQKAGRPNGYILGEDAGGAIVAGLRYGEGMLYTKDAGTHRVFWQGPSLGYDFGAEGSKTMVLVYNLRDPAEIFDRFAGVQGSAYLVGGVGIQFLKGGDVLLAPIRSGVGLRFGANIGYLKYTRRPTWNPF